MRPARKGPENHPLDESLDLRLRASMRPARKGPENPGAGAPPDLIAAVLQ